MFSVDCGVVAGRKFPNDGWSRDLCGRDDDLGEGLSFFEGEEDYFFEDVFWIVAEGEGDDVGGDLSRRSCLRLRLGIGPDVHSSRVSSRREGMSKGETIFQWSCSAADFNASGRPLRQSSARR